MAQQFLLKSVDDGAQTEIAGLVIAGRNPDCGLRLPEGGPEGGPSRKHAQLSLGDGALWIEDLGSKNGTFVNDQRVAAKTRLRAGDRVRFDKVAFVVQVPAEDKDPQATAERPGEQIQPPAAPKPARKRKSAGRKAAPAAAAGAASEATVAVAPRAVDKDNLKETAVPGAWADPEAKPSDGKTVLISPDKVKEMIAQPAKGSGNAGKVDAPTLTCVSGPQAGKRFILERLARRGEKLEWTLGSEAGQDVVLTGDGVSGQHATVVNEGDRWRIMDRLSSNGTFVNNRRTNTSFLSSGDQVRLGTVECIFELPYVAPRLPLDSARSNVVPLRIPRPQIPIQIQRIDHRTLAVSFVVTAAILVVLWHFFMR